MSSQIQVFASFDLEHDAELYERLLADSRINSSGFQVLGGSEHLVATDVWSERVRRSIREADQLIVLCGAHTRKSRHVAAELRIAREENTPYFLLWGRREVMCTKPKGAAPSDGMYTWTPQTLQERMAVTLRKATAEAAAREAKAGG
jgi:hypothetical protein